MKDQMKNKLSRLERICNVIDDTLSRLEPDFNPETFNFYRYNFWMDMFDEEVSKNRNVVTYKLKISPFMEVTIARTICLIEDHERYQQWHGFTRDQHRNAIGRDRNSDERIYKRR